MTERDIFVAARDKTDPAAQAAFLDETCGDDAALRMRIERLLRADAAPDSILDTPACPPRDIRQSETRALPPDLQDGIPPQKEQGVILSFLSPAGRADSLGRIGHYEVLEVLGQGGYGIVLRAFDDVLQRVVAVKVLAPEMAAMSPARKRFLREAQSAAKIRHENVVQVHAVEEQPLPYLVMDFIPGESLQQRLDRTGPLELHEVLRIGRQIAEGLAAAHANKLIHRDVKPANVLIEGGPHKHVKLTDFGLARTADDASLTQSGFIAGTPMYMSPEQARGEPFDHRSDLFSLGSVLYVMTTGRPPFRAAHSLAVLARVSEDTPRPIPDIIPETPPWLCDIIARLQAKKPADRFQSAQEVADLLERCLTQLQQPMGPPDMTPGKAATGVAKPTTSRRGWAIAATVLLLCAGLGLSEATGVTQLRGTIMRRFASEEVITQNPVTVTKNGKEVVTISQEIPPVAKDDAGSKAAEPDRKKTVAPEPKDIDPDRAAAEWAMLSKGNAVVELFVDGKEICVEAFDGKTFVGSIDKLPKTPFELRVLNVNRNKYVSDEGLVVLKRLKHLRALQITNTSITDAALFHIKDCKKLEELQLYGTRVSDAGLPHLAGLSELRVLKLKQTRVTEEGLRKLAAALPKCRIEWNRGVIEPAE